MVKVDSLYALYSDDKTNPRTNTNKRDPTVTFIATFILLNIYSIFTLFVTFHAQIYVLDIK